MLRAGTVQRRYWTVVDNTLERMRKKAAVEQIYCNVSSLGCRN
jgi:hypothetical protein